MTRYFLFQASRLPMSIIIVGVGDADFTGKYYNCGIIIACGRSMVVDFVIYSYTGIYVPTDVYKAMNCLKL